MLRIITGTAKGKKLKSPDGEATRPTSERIKEAIFSSLQFDLEGRRVLDLFAGTGQMGLEAISRGAESALFIDSSREVMEIIKDNAKSVGFFDKCRFRVSDAKNYIRKASGREKFDLVFVDPPYSSKCCSEIADRLAKAAILAKGAIVVLESGEEEIDPSLLCGYEIIKSTHYGKKSFVNIILYTGVKE